MPRVAFGVTGRRIVAIALLLGFVGAVAACNGEAEETAPGPPTPTDIGTVDGLGRPTPETFPAVAGERWGGFIFFDEPDFTVPPDQITPAPRPLEPGEGDLLFDRHPGYREFLDPADLAAFVAGRVPVRVPDVLPPDTELLGGYAVIGDDESVISVGLGYRIGESDAPLHDSDLWISHGFWRSRPVALSVFDRSEVLAPRLLVVRGEEAIYQQSTERPSSRTGSSLNWFESDGSSWAVQGLRLDLSTLVAIAESLTDVE